MASVGMLSGTVLTGSFAYEVLWQNHSRPQLIRSNRLLSGLVFDIARAISNRIPLSLRADMMVKSVFTYYSLKIA